MLGTRPPRLRKLVGYHSGCQVSLSKPLAAPPARTASAVLFGTLFLRTACLVMYFGIERACDFAANELRRKR